MPSMVLHACAPAFMRLKQEGHEFVATLEILSTLGHTTRPSLKKIPCPQYMHTFCKAWWGQ